jgi:hypothetical protein
MFWLFYITNAAGFSINHREVSWRPKVLDDGAPCLAFYSMPSK